MPPTSVDVTKRKLKEVKIARVKSHLLSFDPQTIPQVRHYELSENSASATWVRQRDNNGPVDDDPAFGAFGTVTTKNNALLRTRSVVTEPDSGIAFNGNYNSYRLANISLRKTGLVFPSYGPKTVSAIVSDNIAMDLTKNNVAVEFQIANGNLITTCEISQVGSSQDPAAFWTNLAWALAAAVKVPVLDPWMTVAVGVVAVFCADVDSNLDVHEGTAHSHVWAVRSTTYPNGQRNKATKRRSKMVGARGISKVQANNPSRTSGLLRTIYL